MAGASAQSPVGPPSGFLLDRGRYSTIPDPASRVAINPFGINERGQIGGFTLSNPDGTEAHGFLLAQGIKGPFTPIDFPGAPGTIAFKINDRGQIVGVYDNTAASPSGKPSPMPMPMMMSRR